MDGLLLVDKPGGYTSHDVVARTRRAAATRRVGHAGTLDPMATGLLVLGVNRATRLLTYVVGVDKTYTATIRLGQATVTDDAEGEFTTQADASAVGSEHIEQALARLRGEILQVPSAVSAIKIDGRRSYARVRAGEDVELAARPVTIRRFEVHEEHRRGEWIDLDVMVECSSGTYIRALARDLGAALGVGGHLTALRRTRVGPFDVERAQSLESVMEEGPRFLSVSEAASALFPVWQPDPSIVMDARYGRRVPAPGQLTALADPDGVVVALINPEGKPVLVLAPA